MNRKWGIITTAILLLAGSIMSLTGCARAQETAESYEIVIETEPETIVIETEAVPEEATPEEI